MKNTKYNSFLSCTHYMYIPYKRTKIEDVLFISMLRNTFTDKTDVMAYYTIKVLNVFGLMLVGKKK